jgi:uncharacterized membrane protein YqjE
MEEAPPTEGGIFSSVARLLKTVRDVAENRLELFLLELKEERIRLFDALFLLGIGIICALMTLVMVTLTIVMIFWDTHRLVVLILVTTVYALGAVVAILKLRSRLQSWQDFSATLEQIKKDRSCLEKGN